MLLLKVFMLSPANRAGFECSARGWGEGSRAPPRIGVSRNYSGALPALAGESGFDWRSPVAMPLRFSGCGRLKATIRVVLVGGGNAPQFCRGALKRYPHGFNIDLSVCLNRCPLVLQNRPLCLKLTRGLFSEPWGLLLGVSGFGEASHGRKYPRLGGCADRACIF